MNRFTPTQSLFLLAWATFFLMGCQSESTPPVDAHTMENTPTQAELGNGYTVHHPDTVTQDVAYLRSLINLPASAPGAVSIPAATSPSSLILGFPQQLLGQEQIFGGVITKVSDSQKAVLGRLKLTSLPPVHVRTAIVERTPGKFSMVLVGCPSRCTPTSDLVPILLIPVVGADPEKKLILLDFSQMGTALNIMRSIDPSGRRTQLETETSKVTQFDYSQSTLVFDVEVTMIPINSFFGIGAPRTKITVRWFLKPVFEFSNQWTPRPPTPGVGFFLTKRAASPQILRFPVSPSTKIQYYVKNVPNAYQGAFRKAFESWNEVLTVELGTAPLKFTFVNQGHPLHGKLVTGDVRYRIVEWDKDNLAPYGGLGPAIANQMTGEIFSANVLVQGPKIVRLYSEWFQVGEQADRWARQGLANARESLQARQRVLFRHLATERLLEKKLPKWEVSLGNLPFVVPAQLPQFQDPIMARQGFDLIPNGMDYTTYMEGYFQELVGHELGHNLGLRHNFRGNLSATPSLQVGAVSSSIMEYLGRSYRYLNRIGTYDRMAIRYGYLGRTPQKTDGYCTDENIVSAQRPSNSPECSRRDAGPDPFAFFQSQIKRGISLVLNVGEDTAGDWTLVDMESQLKSAIEGLAFYANTKTAATWTNFFSPNGRPLQTSLVPGYVRSTLKSLTCDKTWDDEVAEKSEEAHRALAAQKLYFTRDYIAKIAASTGNFQVTDLACQ